ncbi:hypothetical protein BH11BAC5_BH11BAC5_32810 [soil metagenome]|jgi:hypothetical protein
MSQSNTELRDKLHLYIDKVEDKKLEALYVLFEHEIEEDDIYSDEFKAALDKQYSDYKADGIVVSEEEADKRINNVLHGLRNK